MGGRAKLFDWNYCIIMAKDFQPSKTAGLEKALITCKKTPASGWKQGINIFYETK
jgi:hypothetical protein